MVHKSQAQIHGKRDGHYRTCVQSDNFRPVTPRPLNTGLREAHNA
jgi:hypothetical protein